MENSVFKLEWFHFDLRKFKHVVLSTVRMYVQIVSTECGKNINPFCAKHTPGRLTKKMFKDFLRVREIFEVE